jgi:CHAT domain-containing protein
MVELAEHLGVLWAVIVRNKRYRLIELGAESEVTSEVESLRFALRRLARGRGSIAAATSVAQRLDDLVFQPLGLTDGPVVLVPTPGLYATPWHTLPSCRQRPVTITPSAELWHRASQSDRVGKSVLLAAGPDLELSDSEVREVGALYPSATMLMATESTVGRVQALLDGAHVAHVATHAVFQLENPMFSSLRLVDGDLSVYDIERLVNAPDVVVLSACDSGFTDTHAGEELMGLSAALLNMGTKTIIASIGLVPDSEATKDLMVALHRGLVSGLSTSQALHRAQVEAAETPEGFVAASSFICIGAG